jgi:hypothetical protein
MPTVAVGRLHDMNLTQRRHVDLGRVSSSACIAAR